MIFTKLKATGAAVLIAMISAGGTAYAGEDKGLSKGLSSWVQGANEAVDQVMNYPYFAKRRGLSGGSTFKVTINRDGDVIESELIDSSGRRIFQQAGKRVVKKADFPALPKSYQGEELRFSLNVNYQMVSTIDQMLNYRKQTRVKSEKISAGTPVAGRITILSQAGD